MKTIELLAPAGNMESLYAAVQSGADAVYLGGDKFSARAYADNFDRDNINKAVEYCHLYNVKIYVTINTSMKEHEIKDAMEYADFLYSIGVDALITQDIGFSMLVKKYIPDFELHASTQMTVHNLYGALFLESLGFQRVVLSRELSLEEIEKISKSIRMETEVFIHGALCVCYSGQCLMSSIIGGRSGNRGRCAQPCRLPYDIVDVKSGLKKSGYLLSTKDMCTIDDIKVMMHSGVASLKIEGRMKRPEYVAGVVSEYRKAVDNCEKNKSKGDNSRNKLLQLFNREGFSKAYLFKNEGRDMMAYVFPRNTGVEIGKVDKNMNIHILQNNLCKGDGIRNNRSGFIVSKIIKKDGEMEIARKGDVIKVVPLKYKSGDTIYKTSDLHQMEYLKAIYKNPYRRKINLNLKVKFKIGERIVLCTWYNNKEFISSGEVVQRPLKNPVTKERIIDSLSKSGNNVFKFYNIKFLEYESGFIPVSCLNSIRRKLIEKIEKDVLNRNLYINNTQINNREKIKKINCERKFNLPDKIVFINSLEQLKAFDESNLDSVCINYFDYRDMISSHILHNKKVYVKIPNIIKKEFDHICKFIDENSSKIQGVVTANLGIINRFKNKLNIIGDYKLNIFNSNSLEFYNQFTSGNCISVELGKKDVKDMLENTLNCCQMLVYGKIELMVSEYCVVGSTFGGKTGSGKCSKPCTSGEYCLVDRKKERFVVKVDKFCRSHIYNSVPENLINNMYELRNFGIKSFRMDFTDESYDETKSILNAFINEKWNGDFSKFTRGNYKRGVE